MTDPNDELARARAALKKAAASQLARKEAREAEVAQLEAKVAELRDGRARAEAAGDAALVRDVEAALSSLTPRLELAQQDLAQVSHDLQESLQNLRESESLGRTLDRTTLKREVAALTSPDPYAPGSAVDNALANVRDHIEELDARAEVMDELNADARAQADVQRRLDALDRPSKEDAARAELERLKAARRGAPPAERSLDPAPAAPDDDDAPADAPRKPKRTL